MKRYSISQLQKLSLDDEEIILPSTSQWFDLFHGALLDDKPLFAVGLAKLDYELVKDIEQFKVGLRQLRANGPWTPILLFSHGSVRNQHIQLERLTCSQCKTEVWSANHLVYDLYIKTSSPSDIYERAKVLPRACCPVCNETLPRPSLFAFVKI